MDNSGSVSNEAPAKTADKKADVSGSVLDTPVAKPADKKLTNDGSVAPETKKAEAKPVASTNWCGKYKWLNPFSTFLITCRHEIFHACFFLLTFLHSILCPGKK